MGWDITYEWKGWRLDISRGGNGWNGDSIFEKKTNATAVTRNILRNWHGSDGILHGTGKEGVTHGDWKGWKVMGSDGMELGMDTDAHRPCTHRQATDTA